MEWTCAKCGRTARAEDWTLLLSLGWRTTPDNEFRCATCALKPPERMPAVKPVPAGRRGVR
jgi:hypothetical protein